jgi:choline dehydrogenase-like flavoprotein
MTGNRSLQGGAFFGHFVWDPKLQLHGAESPVRSLGEMTARRLGRSDRQPGGYQPVSGTAIGIPLGHPAHRQKRSAARCAIYEEILLFIDARTLPESATVETDLCIIGAGAAGITLGRELVSQPFRICLLESGGLELDAETQALYEGETIGHPYLPLTAARLRYFGGSTGHWNGLCRPLDPLDFAARDWVPHSGWPLDRAQLEPYYRRAQEICHLGPFAYECADWETPDRPRLPLDGTRIASGFFQHSHDPASTEAGKWKPVRFGTLYRDDIGRAPNISTYLHANAVDLETNEAADRVSAVRVATLAGNALRVCAQLFVLATGGIENARLLLASNRRQPSGLGNQHDLVGRYFMDHHAGGHTGLLMLSDPATSLRMYRNSWTDHTWIRGFLGLTPATQRREKMLNCGFFTGLRGPLEAPGMQSLRTVLHAVRDGDMPEDLMGHLGNIIADLDDVAGMAYRRLTGHDPAVFPVKYWGEPAPNPDSRVLLGPERDRFGMRRVQLSWQLSAIDLFTLRRAHQLLAEELGGAGVGRLQLAFKGEAIEPPPLHGSCHHMGTTRMHPDPKQGVVDANCRVHGIGNLYVAGSSVFPTAGQANPTLTLVALATRLADHIEGLLA